MSKHTPGPWSRYVYDHGGSRIYRETDDSNGINLIADTYEPKGNSDLLFAAPDMYRALHGLMQAIVAPVDDSQLPDAVAKAEEAIAKAEGGGDD